MKYIDCFGDICPVPILKIQKEIKNIQPGDTIKVVSDHSCVVESIKDKFKKKKDMKVSIEEVMNGVWEIYISKKKGD